MVDTKISAFTDGVTAAATDRLAGARSPFGSGDNRYITPAYIKDYILGLANTWTANQTYNGLLVFPNTGIPSAPGNSAIGNGRDQYELTIFNNLEGTATFRYDSGLRMGANQPIGWSSSSNTQSNPTGPDTRLYRDAAYIIGQRNGTNAQAFRVYGTFTDASNYERGALNAGADYIELAAETAGTGDDNMDVRLTPAGTGNVRFGTHSAVGAETVTGFITIKDAAGNSRKLAVIS